VLELRSIIHHLFCKNVCYVFFASSVCNCLVLPMLVFSTKRLSESSFYLNSFCVSKFDTSWNIIVGCNIYLRFWHLSAPCTYLCFKEKILQTKKKPFNRKWIWLNYIMAVTFCTPKFPHPSPEKYQNALLTN
jgi:hypothetical protein